jgi:hypothetical protein
MSDYPTRVMGTKRRLLQEYAESGEDLAVQVAEFGGTIRDLTVFSGESAAEVKTRLSTARDRELMRPSEIDPSSATEEDVELELLQAVGFEFNAKHHPSTAQEDNSGLDSIYKSSEAHRRAVASVAAALAATNRHIVGEVGITRYKRMSRNRYLCDLKFTFGPKVVRHCADIVVFPDGGEETSLTVVDILLAPRRQSELRRICSGWGRHQNVSEIVFYASSQTIDSVREAIAATHIEAITTVYLLPDDIQASALLHLEPQIQPPSGPVGGDRTPEVVALTESQESAMIDILEWIAIWGLAGPRAMSIYSDRSVESVTTELLLCAQRRGLVTVKRVMGEGSLYMLSAAGAELLGISDFRGPTVVRRNINYLCRRMEVVADLTAAARTQAPDIGQGRHAQLLNPQNLGAAAPAVDVDVGGTVRRWGLDVIVSCTGPQASITGVLILTGYEPYGTYESLFTAWSGSDEVDRVLVYVRPSVYEQLSELAQTVDRWQQLRLEVLPHYEPLDPSYQRRRDAKRLAAA